jgi:hypothetical protein
MKIVDEACADEGNAKLPIRNFRILCPIQKTSVCSEFNLVNKREQSAGPRDNSRTGSWAERRRSQLEQNIQLSDQ